MNKKNYNFTEKQSRRDRFVGSSCWNNAPKSYIKSVRYEKAFRRYNKHILHKIILEEPYYFDIDSNREFKYSHRHDAVWFYW